MKNNHKNVSQGKKLTSINQSKKMEIHGLPDKEFKITVTKMLKELRKMMHEQTENINKEVKSIKKRTKQILEKKTTMTELKIH